MSFRTGTAQSIHDRVIAVVAQTQTQNNTYTNPGHEHNWSVSIGQETVYPDLLLWVSGTHRIAHLIEVETTDSVNEAESGQWATYALGPGQFWLLVPANSLATAKVICQRRGI